MLVTMNERTRSRFAQLGRDAGYLLISWPVILVGMVLEVTLLALGAGTVIIWVGLPILVAAAMLARGFASLERGTVARLKGVDAPPSPYKPSTGGRFGWLAPLRDEQTWRDVLWLVAGLFVSTVTFSLALVWLAGAIGTVAGPVAGVVLDLALGDGYRPWTVVLGLPFPHLLNALSQFIVGLGFALTASPVLRGLARFQQGFGELLLTNPAKDRARIDALTTSRSAARSAETDALRRLERDIHDGPQQRLVRMNMDLARARRQAQTNPEQAASILDHLMQQNQETLDELRMLSRGIAPPVLVDRGLEAAIVQLAGRSSVPVTTFVNVPRLPGHVEIAAYYVVSEALANINKHSGARSASVTTACQDGKLYVVVHDDGTGGASMAKGHGLAGLRDRLAGVDGTFDVHSPEGGPTEIEAEIPCDS